MELGVFNYQSLCIPDCDDDDDELFVGFPERYFSLY
jgi:hypothetical protein